MNGIWSSEIEKQYIDKHSEKLPSLWLEDLEAMDVIKVESPVSGKYIVFPFTPPVGRGSAPLPHHNFHSPPREARVSQTNGSGGPKHQSPPPPLQPPTSNSVVDELWEVYITFIKATNHVSLRFIGDEYSERFEEMSTNMELCYYDMASIPRVMEPEVGFFGRVQFRNQLHT